MYQLLMAGAGWQDQDRLDEFEAGRVLEYTEPTVKSLFVQDGRIAAEQFVGIPAVFAQESGVQEHVVRFGEITRARIVDKPSRRGPTRVVEFDYVVDPDTPTMTNSELERLAPKLGIESFEFSRTHWAIKDVDLYRVLFERANVSVLRPSVFHFNGNVDKNLVSVMMPFDAALNDVYTTIESAAQALRFRCTRADNIWVEDAIIQDVVTLIRTSAVVVCDLSGKNANVFYETGIAHALGAKVVLLAQHETDVPFDLRHLRHIRYINNSEGRAALSKQLMARLETITK